METEITRIVRAQGMVVVERHEPARIFKRARLSTRLRRIFPNRGAK